MRRLIACSVQHLDPTHSRHHYHGNEADLAHLQLEEPPLLLHLFSDFRPADFRPYHPVLPRVLLLLLLYLGADGTQHHTG